MSLKTCLYLSLIVIVAIVAYMTVQAIIDNAWILLFPAAPLGLSALWFLINFSLIVREKRLIIQAQRHRAQLEATLIQSGGETWVKERIIKILPDGRKEISDEFARLGGYRLRVNSHDHKPTEVEILNATIQQSTAQTKMMVSGGPLAQLMPPHPLELLPLLDKAERVLIKGASDAGKTELLRHIVQRSSGVLVIDPHFAPGIWPIADNRVVGKARNYQEIDAFLHKLLAELNGRYQRRAAGETNFQQVTVIVDEFQSVREECKDAGKILSTLIRESRKVGFRLFIGSHSELVKPLGLEGQGDIRDGLLIVRLTIDQITKRRVCTVDFGNGEQECWFPPLQSSEPEIVLPDLVVRLSPEESKVSELLAQGRSRSAIAREVFGDDGGNQLKKVDKIIEKLS